jgi:hypothetical protein
MPLSSYKSMSTTIKEFQLTYAESSFVVETPFNLSDYFREDLQTVMREGGVDNSDAILRKSDLSSFEGGLEALQPKVYALEPSVSRLRRSSDRLSRVYFGEAIAPGQNRV